MVTDAFAKWATGFSGCYGGNLYGSTWVCGMEFGLGHDEGELHRNIYKVAVSTPSAVETPNWGDPNERRFETYPYNWNALKLLCAVNGGDVTKYKDFYRDKRCFASSSDYFKLNLYPIGFAHFKQKRWQP
jgi:hypothetical protein